MTDGKLAVIAPENSLRFTAPARFASTSAR
jgi:hypothetical protein